MIHGTFEALLAAAGHEDREPVGDDWTVSGHMAVALGGRGAGSGGAAEPVANTDELRLADFELVYSNAATAAGSIAEMPRVGAADNRTRDH